MKIKDNEISDLHHFGIDVKNAHIYLMGVEEYVGAGWEYDPGVEFAMANRLIKNINTFMFNNINKPIIIHMKTDGGFVDEGLAIFDAISMCPLHVKIINYGGACSMSSVIFQAGDERIMMPNSHFMFHMGSNEISGTAKQVSSAMEFYKNWENLLVNIYVKRMKERGKFSNKTETFIKNWLIEQMNKKEDVFLTPKETVDLGLADKIFESW